MEDVQTTTVAPRSRAAEIFLFATNFLRHPSMLGSVIPSSRFLVEHVLAPVDWAQARVVVEYGPGVGTFTAEILRRLRADARLVAIETNPQFVRFMRETLPDNRLRVEQGSAEDVASLLAKHGLPPANVIISGIPLGSFPRALQRSIVTASRDALAADGRFLVYQFTARVLPVLRETFARVERSREVRNFPPGQLFQCSNER
ncbi:MAG TPA: methyltransferase [Steroidobacteraceae bacterium]|nr:methyltransferase [Steroidobacteraceae bacterium]